MRPLGLCWPSPWHLTAACSASGSDSRSDAKDAKSAPPPATDAKAGAAAVAEGKGVSVTAAEVEQKIEPENLMDLRQKEYELRKAALDELLNEKLMAKEAQAQGISVDELRKREVDAKATPPDPADVARLYAQNERRFGGVPKEQAMATVENAVRGRNRELRAAEFRQELIRKHGVKILLQPPRHEVPVPADAPSLGPASAPVTIVEFADYQCPYCHQAPGHGGRDPEALRGQGPLRAPRLPDRQHPSARERRLARVALRGRAGQVLGVPPRPARRGAATSRDARPQAPRARRSRLNAEPSRAALRIPTGDAPIRTALEDGRKLGVQATPTFFINGRRMVGARGLPRTSSTVIEDELAAADLSSLDLHTLRRARKSAPHELLAPRGKEAARRVAN